MSIAKHYYENGTLKCERCVGDVWSLRERGGGDAPCRKHGIEKEYYENGKLKAEMPYKDSKIQGDRKIYGEKGNMIIEISYKNDDLQATTRPNDTQLTAAHIYNIQSCYANLADNNESCIDIIIGVYNSLPPQEEAGARCALLHLKKSLRILRS